MTDTTWTVEGITKLLGVCSLRDASLFVAGCGALAHKPFRNGFHQHNHWEIFAVITGNCLFESLAMPTPLVIPAGGILLVPPKNIHMLVTLLEQPPDLEAFVVGLPDEVEGFNGSVEWIPKNGNDCGMLPLSKLHVRQWNELLSYRLYGNVETAAEAARSGNDWGRRRAVATICMVLNALGEVIAEMLDDVDTADSAKSRTMKTIAILHNEHHDPDLSVKLLSERMGISACHLAEIFKKETGVTIHKTLMDIRLMGALTLLEHGTYSIKEVASLTGWRNQLYFSTAFRKHFGVPPSRFKQRTLNN